MAWNHFYHIRWPPLNEACKIRVYWHDHEPVVCLDTFFFCFYLFVCLFVCFLVGRGVKYFEKAILWVISLRLFQPAMSVADGMAVSWMFCFFCFFFVCLIWVLTSQSAAMVMSKWSVNLTALRVGSYVMFAWIHCTDVWVHCANILIECE